MMRRMPGLLLRLLVIAALAMILPLVAARSGGPPYLSALSDLAVSRTAAATGCEMKDCAGGSRHNLACAKVTSLTQCSIFSGTCISSGCP